jgi:hypothetical protein
VKAQGPLVEGNVALFHDCPDHYRERFPVAMPVTFCII